ncbi:hypothetical protein EV586_11032 [Tumebacillus sp. BK434]|uniref:GNAT family N-acetyltransferase n=1 Tax=Tumebacillus sp. BK434 TaxID=2512169 RepID=UPI0010E0899F|nr:GNAT family N-acetyltransferase [Tumebacillus sp. BK434]TCP52433.1 hypothetical protein EV586_11032 [Tumebacillus sp. BK434]
MQLEIVKMADGEQEAELRAFWGKDPYYGLFFSGNMRSMGLGDPMLDYWGGYVQGRLAAVLMRYRANWSILTQEEALDLSPMIRLAEDSGTVNTVTGRVWVVERFEQQLTRFVIEEQSPSHFCTLQVERFAPAATDGVRQAFSADGEKIRELYQGGEMDYLSAEIFRRRMEKEGARCYVLEAEDGRLIACAMTLVETEQAAMIGTVYTHPVERGKGYASRVMSALCAALLADGKEPCLFYSNPAAGTVYLRLGFADIGTFKMTDFQAAD